MPVFEIYEAKIEFGQHEFNHLFLVANITEDVLMGLDVMWQHKFHFNLKNSIIKINRDEFSVKMVEQMKREVTLQGNYLPRAMKARPCQEGCKRLKMAETETPCRRVVLKSQAFRTQKILETHHRRDIDLGVPVEQVGGKCQFGRHGIRCYRIYFFLQLYSQI